jgi:hypothetical protein
VASPYLEAATTLYKHWGGEPFAHELIRESRSLVSSAPRSALLIGFSALETGLKSHLSFLLPGGEALIDNIPSPPVVVLLQEVLPRIHSMKGIESKYIPLPSSPSKFLQKWKTQRDQITHGVKRSVDNDGLVQVIDLITDILYILDISRGHAWALNHIRSGFFE